MSERRRGRPTEYTPELAAEICRQLAEGKTLRRICKADDMPPESTVRRWVLDDRSGFAAHYATAREIGYQCMADELLDIADDNSRDTAVDEGGHETTNHDVIARSRLRVDTRKWLLSKALPKVYGDKVTQEVTGADGAPLVPIINLSGRS
ncbi:terminase small subunit protein [Bradyrhizobium oligotrophicum]|uniref:terminase small subunit-like protein n=1 Tax=Bradyrhizobium oligotrophicum TaxID=44255 RepID=UPI003EC15247